MFSSTTRRLLSLVFLGGLLFAIGVVSLQGATLPVGARVTSARVTLGQAALAGKLNLYLTGNDLDLIDTYTILGDPALRIALLPSEFRLFLPIIMRP